MIVMVWLFPKGALNALQEWLRRLFPVLHSSPVVTPAVAIVGVSPSTIAVISVVSISLWLGHRSSNWLGEGVRGSLSPSIPAPVPTETISIIAVVGFRQGGSFMMMEVMTVASTPQCGQHYGASVSPMSVMSISLWICDRLWLWVRPSGCLGHRRTSAQGSEKEKQQQRPHDFPGSAPK